LAVLGWAAPSSFDTLTLHASTNEFKLKYHAALSTSFDVCVCKMLKGLYLLRTLWLRWFQWLSWPPNPLCWCCKLSRMFIKKQINITLRLLIRIRLFHSQVNYNLVLVVY
jgi:hypothetical protein